MNLTRNLLYASLALAVVALGAGYLLARLITLAIVIAALGGLWLAALHRNWNWYPALGFIVFMIAAGVGLLAGLNQAAMLIGLTASLAAWDLSYFDRNLRAAKVWTPALDRIQRRHLARLGIVLAGGCLLATAEFLIRIRLNMWVAVLLGLIAVWSLVLLVRALHKSSR